MNIGANELYIHRNRAKGLLTDFRERFKYKILGLRHDCSTIKFDKKRTNGLRNDLTMYQLTKLTISSQKIVKKSIA